MKYDLFGEIITAQAEWQDMPEFFQEDLTPYIVLNLSLIHI